VIEYPLNYPSGTTPSTHEIIADPNAPGVYLVSAPLHNALVRFDSGTGRATYLSTGDPSAPHGMTFDRRGRFWVLLEGRDEVAQVDAVTGEILKRVELPKGTGPHGIGRGADGLTVWFTGKAAGTVGKVDPDTGAVSVYKLSYPPASTPIYVVAGPDGNMWGTELDGNKIFRVTPQGAVTEFPIPSADSRPIVITPAPKGAPFLWFSEEKSHKVARISTQTGQIDEFFVPRTQDNSILAGLAFDREGNLFTQSYVSQKGPQGGPDFIVRLSKEILAAPAGDLSGVTLTRYQAPSTGTVFHRIILGDDGNLYFTELGLDRVGRLLLRATP
jgi:virginiamycin B lyase